MTRLVRAADAHSRCKTPAMLALFVILVVSGSQQQTSARQLLATGENYSAGSNKVHGGGLPEAQARFPGVAKSIVGQVATKISVPEAFHESGPVQGRELGTGEEERAALVALHGSAGGASWTNQWDLSSADHCSWHGVECGSSGEVTELNLNSNGLKGTLPADLNTLTSLVNL